jgi:hypothetical protein
MLMPSDTTQNRRIRPGTGDWGDWSLPLESVYAAAREWEKALQGIERPWLCWNISPRWCELQQNLVREVGWTPVVGYDPRGDPPPLAPGAVLVNFNEKFGFDEMWLHFPVEWAFLYTDRLAFWHSDLLCRLPVMQRLADLFGSLGDGEMAAVREDKGWRHIFDIRNKRYWELAGCTTRAASRSQFEHGAGWWRHIALHPSCKDPAEKARREKYYYDHGVGVMYWKRNYKGRVREIESKQVDEGHCTAIGKKNYIQLSAERTTSDKIFELDLNYNIREVAERLKIAHLLPDPPRAQS